MFDRSFNQWIGCLLAIAVTSGCSMGKKDGWKFTKSLNVRRAVGLKKDEDKLAPPQVPTRLVSTWKDTTLTKQGETPKRGFGGRLLFFNEESEDPIRVEGQLVVYAYDDSGRAAHETQPTRRFIFPAEQFVRHESQSQVGPSYSIWLPWDEVGGEQKNIGLIARFESKAGALIVGEQTRHLLPGTRQLATGETAPAVQPVSNIQLTQFTRESKLEPPSKSATSAQGQRPQVTSIALARKKWGQRLGVRESEPSGQTANATAPEQAPVLPASNQ